MSNRRLIEMIRGRAKAGDPNTISDLAAHPRVTRALSRASIGIGAAGVLCVGLSTLGGGMLEAAASAGVSAGSSGGGSGASTAEEVAGLTAGETVEVATLDTVADAAPSAIPAVAEAPVAPAAVEVTTPVTVAIASVRQPAVVAPPAPPAAPGTVEAVITEVFGSHAAAAIGVARCESGLRPEAISRGGGNWGLFQINRVHRDRVARMGFQWEQLLDARVNALVAKTIFDEQGWGPWACRHAAR